MTKRALTIALMSLALSGMYVSPSQANCMDDVHQMRDQVTKYGHIYTIEGVYIDDIRDPWAATGNPCRAYAYGNVPYPYPLKWQESNWGDTLTAR